eukprot:g5213.t1
MGRGRGRGRGIVKEQVDALKGLWQNKRMLAFQGLNLAMIVFSALMIWKSLMVYTRSESPVVVVLSGSMEPAFQRGDILFLNNDPSPLQAGEIVVFKIEGRDIPIVHRILTVHEGDTSGEDGAQETKYLTKGDHNHIDDRGLYKPGQLWLKRKHILGRARGALPYVGMVTIVLNDYPTLKYVLVGVMGLFVLTNKDS